MIAPRFSLWLNHLQTCAHHPMFSRDSAAHRNSTQSKAARGALGVVKSPGAALPRAVCSSSPSCSSAVLTPSLAEVRGDILVT